MADELDMSAVPRKIDAKIRYFETHVGRWGEHASEIGSSPETIAALAASTAAARQAYVAQQLAQQAARMATQAMKHAVAEMSKRGALVVQQVRATASTGGDGVYELAGVTPVAKRSPIGPPGMPTNFQVELQAIGILTLRWQCKNPRGSKGTQYRICRDDTGTGAAFQVLGMVGVKRYVDEALPAGLTSVLYKVQALRSTRKGDATLFRVSMGGAAKLPTVQRAA